MDVHNVGKITLAISDKKAISRSAREQGINKLDIAGLGLKDD